MSNKWGILVRKWGFKSPSTIDSNRTKSTSFKPSFLNLSSARFFQKTPSESSECRHPNRTNIFSPTARACAALPCCVLSPTTRPSLCGGTPPCTPRFAGGEPPDPPEKAFERKKGGLCANFHTFSALSVAAPFEGVLVLLAGRLRLARGSAAKKRPCF